MNINFNKSGGLIPVIIQDNKTLQVLMLGYMNEEAYIKTQKEGKVSFFSRSKNRLWTKGESSGNFLYVEAIHLDCDQDCLLISVSPQGNTCHKGERSCFQNNSAKGFLYNLENIISERSLSDAPQSYTRSLIEKGINKIAQKVGEEAVELIIEAKDDKMDLFENEAADLLYHFLVLLQVKKSSLEKIESILQSRNKGTKSKPGE